MFLDSVYKYFVEEFRICIIQRYWPVNFFFFCSVFAWFGVRATLAS